VIRVQWKVVQWKVQGVFWTIGGDTGRRGRYKGDMRSFTGDIARFAIGDPEKTQEDAWRFVHGDPGWEV
jgi:hypothetical protein